MPVIAQLSLEETSKQCTAQCSVGVYSYSINIDELVCNFSIFLAERESLCTHSANIMLLKELDGESNS